MFLKTLASNVVHEQSFHLKSDNFWHLNFVFGQEPFSPDNDQMCNMIVKCFFELKKNLL